MRKISVPHAILLAGFIAGTIDIGAAALISGAPVDAILRYVAAGLLGPSALRGGWGIAAVGMLLQWAMSLVIAAIYILAAQRFPRLKTLWWLRGIGYGVVVYFVMTFAVVPLSAIGHGLPHPTLYGFTANILAMWLFGLIVAFFAQRT